MPDELKECFYELPNNSRDEVVKGFPETVKAGNTKPTDGITAGNSIFGIGSVEMTLEEIGEHFGLTRERVRQIKEKAIRRLRHSARSKLLKSYLG